MLTRRNLYPGLLYALTILDQVKLINGTRVLHLLIFLLISNWFEINHWCEKRSSVPVDDLNRRSHFNYGNLYELG